LAVGGDGWELRRDVVKDGILLGRASITDGYDIMKARLPGMKTLEFDAQLASHDQIRVPAEVVDQIPEGAVLRVILLLDGGEDEGWRQLSLDRFAAAYSEEDAVYEELEYGLPA